MNILQVIQNKYPSFSLKEKSVATYILQNSQEIKNLTIGELAELTSTSTSTLTRFAKKIGCENYVEMKININAASQSEPQKKDKETFQDIYYFYSKVIDQTNQRIDKDAMDKLVEDIRTSSKIYLYGVGSSGLTANELMQRLIRMGLNVSCITDSHMMKITSSISNSDDLVIGISASGETEEIVTALENAQKNNSKTVAITSFSQSELSSIADYGIYVYNTRFIDNERFINSQFAIMYVIDILSTMLLRDEYLSDRMDRTIDVVINKER